MENRRVGGRVGATDNGRFFPLQGGIFSPLHSFPTQSFIHPPSELHQEYQVTELLHPSAWPRILPAGTPRKSSQRKKGCFPFQNSLYYCTPVQSLSWLSNLHDIRGKPDFTPQLVICKMGTTHLGRTTQKRVSESAFQIFKC